MVLALGPEFDDREEDEEDTVSPGEPLDAFPVVEVSAL